MTGGSKSRIEIKNIFFLVDVHGKWAAINFVVLTQQKTYHQNVNHGFGSQLPMAVLELGHYAIGMRTHYVIPIVFRVNNGVSVASYKISLAIFGTINDRIIWGVYALHYGLLPLYCQKRYQL